jgi:hypothetical protein
MVQRRIGVREGETPADRIRQAPAFCRLQEICRTGFYSSFFINI